MIIGLIIGIYKEMYLSRKYNISFSAGQALQYRWIMHYFDTRPDQLTVDFTKKFPCESHFGLFTTMGAFIISHKLLRMKSSFTKLVEPGYETLNKIAGNRVLLFDKILKKHLPNIEQLVIPGAGFDLIAQRYTKDKNIQVYELDQVNTIKLKEVTLEKAKIESSWIKYIPVDYATESWIEKLLENGFDKNKKTLILWQSVSLYLEEELVVQNLKNMNEMLCEGSIIAQDFYATSFLDGSLSKIATKNMNLIGRLGETWKFSLNMKENPEISVREFLAKCNLQLNDYYQFGKKIHAKPFYCITESQI